MKLFTNMAFLAIKDPLFGNFYSTVPNILQKCLLTKYTTQFFKCSSKTQDLLSDPTKFEFDELIKKDIARIQTDK